MNILGIETSCDETAAAVVNDGRSILSNVVVSSLKEHSSHGGIIPEIASRRQMECITSVVDESLIKSELTLQQIDAIAVTKSPGLMGSLLVGLSFARALSYQFDKPLIEINHVQAHIYANFLQPQTNTQWQPPSLPAIGLVVSGGHTQLYLINHLSSMQLIGQTRDDAAGEAFDKVARIMGFGYPGGPLISKAASTGENTNLVFKAGALPDCLDFSFSGIKTAVLYHYQKLENPNDNQRSQIAYSFQQGVISSLIEKCSIACQTHNIRTLLVGGGVSANSELRRQLTVLSEKNKWDIRFPPMPLCVDNAAMIAGMAYHQLKEKRTAKRP